MNEFKVKIFKEPDYDKILKFKYEFELNNKKID